MAENRGTRNAESSRLISGLVWKILFTGGLGRDGLETCQLYRFL
jgi:hypothetical protein